MNTVERFIVGAGMHPVPLVELTEQRAGKPVVMLTITAGLARSLLKNAKARWEAAGELDQPSLYNSLMSRRNAITVMVDRMRTLTDGRAIIANLARMVLAEVGGDTARVGPKPMNNKPARRVFTPR